MRDDQLKQEQAAYQLPEFESLSTRGLFGLRVLRERLRFLIGLCLILVSILLGVVIHPRVPAEIAVLVLFGCVAFWLVLRRLNLISPLGPMLHALQPIRRNRLLTRRSDYVVRNQFNDLLDRKIPFWRSYENRWLWFLTILSLGGIVFPFMLHLVINAGPVPANLIPSISFDGFEIRLPDAAWSIAPLQLMLVGLITTTLLLALYGLWYARRVSPRAIITEFKGYSIDPAYAAQVSTIASTSRRLLNDELKRITELLRQNQVENIHFVAEDANALIMTSGIEAEFFSQLQNVVTVEVANTNSTIDLGRLYASVSRALAIIVINGGVQRHDNGAIEVFVEMRYRNRATAGASVMIDAPVGAVSIDDVLIAKRIREIVLKLLIDLGQIPGTGQSWQALDHFLQGLAASGSRNWWLAISQYYRALETASESGYQTLGVIYYHLGAAFINQQLWDEGHKLLLQAERFGPPMAETQYMLALHALNQYWGELSKSTVAFDEIVSRCKRALRMKPDFAAAQQLLGMTYYRRGRIKERDKHGEHDKGRADYKEALKWFWRALRSYDRTLDKLQRNPDQVHVSIDRSALVRQRLSVTHQIGDALRGLRKPWLAEQFFRDMEVAEPTNIRNVADLLKTNAIAGWHSSAYSFFLKQQMRRTEVRWDADVVVHVGWVLADAARSAGGSTKWEMIIEAYQYLDYALYARPRTVLAWDQTDWRKPFDEATKEVYDPQEDQYLFKKKDAVANFSAVYTAQNAYHARVALGYREWMLGGEKGAVLDQDKQKKALLATWQAFQESALTDASDLFQRFQDLVQEVRDHESQGLMDNRYLEVEQYYQCADIAAKCKRLHDQCKSLFFSNSKLGYPEPKRGTAEFTLANRIRLDFYLLVSLLTARMLAEARRFDPLWKLAKEVKEQLENHRAQWQEAFGFEEGEYNNRSHFTFSVLVFRYQYASMLAWYAYGLLMRDGDLISERVSRRLSANGLPKHGEDSVREASEAIQEAYSLLPVHPLVMYVRARLYAHDRLYPQAIEQLQQLLSIISPYDPKNDVGIVSSEMVQTHTTTSDERKRLYYLERIIGRQQFVNIVRPARIFELMATYAEQNGDLQQAATYLNDAVRRSPYHDKDFYLFERLVSVFNRLERYQNARAIAEAMKIPRERLKTGVAPMGVFRLAPEILELQALTRQGLYERARQLSRRIAREFELQAQDISQLGKKEEAQNQSQSPGKEEVQNQCQLTTIGDGQYLAEFEKRISEQDDEGSDYKERVRQIFSIKDLNGGFAEMLVKVVEAQKSLAKPYNIPGEDRGIFSNMFARITETEKQNEILNTLAARVLWVQNREVIKQLLEGKHSQDDGFAIAKRMHIAIHVGQEARSILTYLGDLMNAMAFNRVMLRQLESIHPLIDATCAVYIFNYLYQTCDHDEPKHGMLSRKLAQSLDTYAWVIYSLGIPERDHDHWERRESVLAHTKRLLLLAQRYDANRAIVYYHLAHVSLDLADLMLEKSERSRHQFFEHLDNAQQAIENARRGDHSKRLGHRLDQLVQRYDALLQKQE